MGNINAGVITKALKAKGYAHAQWNKVGVSTWNDGFYTERAYNFNNAVAVSWLYAGYHRDLTADEVAFAKEHLTEMASVLNERGYETKLMGADQPWLLVQKTA